MQLKTKFVISIVICYILSLQIIHVNKLDLLVKELRNRKGRGAVEEELQTEKNHVSKQLQEEVKELSKWKSATEEGLETAEKNLVISLQEEVKELSRWKSAAEEKLVQTEKNYDSLQEEVKALIELQAEKNYMTKPQNEVSDVSSPSTKNLHIIPSTIWQTAKSHDPPPEAAKIFETWDEKNPAYTRALLDDDKLVAFMESHFNQTVVDAFNALPLPVMKADFFRLAVLYHEGGIYADVDVECVSPIPEWDDDAIHDCEVMIVSENDFHFCNWGMASVARHPLFGGAVELSLSRFVNGVDTTYEHFVHLTTGPALLTDAVRTYVKEVAQCDLGDDDSARFYTTSNLLERCKEKLRDEFGVCLYDDKVHFEWFRNHYSSNNPDLQGEGWVASWTKQRDELVSGTENEMV